MNPGACVDGRRERRATLLPLRLGRLLIESVTGESPWEPLRHSREASRPTVSEPSAYPVNQERVTS